ncbi:tRNA pseudouridine13 synthase, partial [Trypanosoma cruzi]
MVEICSAGGADDREECIGMHFFLTDAILAEKGMNLGFRRPLVSLKTLYSDFVVRELSPLYNNGEPLVLEQLPTVERLDSKLKAVKRPREEKEEEAMATALDAQPILLLEHVQAQFSSLLGPEDLSSLLEALRAGADRVMLRDSSLTKAQRTRVHEAVKNTLGPSYLSRTVDGSLVIEKSTSVSRREEMRRSNPLRLQKFLHFTLYKENMDSNRALRAIAGHLCLPVRQLLFSGTKDKRAVTLQRVAVRGLSCER